jgi:hypothetical protein
VVIGPSQASILDLELLHNFSTKTCVSISEQAEQSHFYQTGFITEALKTDYVLHCLLGLSAFHLVHQHQELLQSAPEQQQPAIRAKMERYLLAAHAHHNAGISAFRQTLTSLTEENCHALFAGATLIVITSFAESCEGVRFMTDSKIPSHEDSDPTVTRWLILLRGAKTVVVNTSEWVNEGPMAPIIGRRTVDGYDSNIGVVHRDVTHYLDSLSAAICEYSEPEVSEICIAAIELLRKSWKGMAGGCDLGVAFFWAVLVEDDFMALLEMKRAEALLILGAYCVLLYSHNLQWWMQGWPKHMLGTIEGIMDERWKVWLQWPWQVIGDEKSEQRRERVLVVTEGMCCQ